MKTLNEPPPRARGISFYVRKLLVIVFCLWCVVISRVIEVMLRSTKIRRHMMNLSLILYMAFIFMWFYTALFIQSRNPRWTETHKRWMYGTMGTAVTAGFLWTIAIWPVFHIWTLPLGTVLIVLVVCVVALIPPGKVPKAD